MKSSDRPNILLFVTDDHADWAARCYGYPQLQTPSFDYLAQSGARFTRAFTSCPVCSPARASLYTGRMPSQHGIHDYLQEHDGPQTHPGLTGQATLAHRLAAVGYQTAHLGKWHCGNSGQPQAGFDHWVCRPEGNEHLGNPRRGALIFHGSIGNTRHYGRHDEIVTRYAIDFIDQAWADSAASKKPFFLSVGLTDTHSPFRDMPERLAQRHRQTNPPREHLQRDMDPCHGTYGTTGQDEWDERPEWIAQYFAAAEALDANVGRIIDHLEARGALNNTLVIYTSDHGHMTGRHGLITKGNATNPQNFIEDSVRVPLIIRWPDGGIDARQVHDAMVTHCDTHRTILDAAQAEVASINPALEDRTGPGRSYLPMLRGEPYTAHDAVYFEYGDAKCVRRTNHKLIVREAWAGRSHPDEFYALDADPWERDNVIDDVQHAAAVSTMRTMAHNFWSRYSDDKYNAQAVAGMPYKHNGNEVWTK